MIAGLVVLTVSALPARAAPNLLTVFEAATARVVGEVEHVTPLRFGAYRARLRVDRLVPERASSDTPEAVDVVWEEPSPALPPRLETGRRVLLGLVPLPSASIWKTRVPDPADRARLEALAGRPPGVLLRPSFGELDILEHYFALTADARRGDAGAYHLVELCLSARPALARDAARLLGEGGALARPLHPALPDLLIDALLRPDAPDARAALLSALASARPAALRPRLEARLVAAGPGATAILSAALGALDDGLDDARALALFDSDAAEARLTAARYARGPKARVRLRRRLVEDASPQVRAAAVERLLLLEGERALPDAVRALADAAPPVRLAAVRSMARLDPEAVPALVDVVDRGPKTAAQAALAALSLMGDDAHRALARIAREAEDPSLRTLAGIAIGTPIGERH